MGKVTQKIAKRSPLADFYCRRVVKCDLSVYSVSYVFKHSCSGKRQSRANLSLIFLCGLLMRETVVGAHLRGAPACREVLPRMSQRTRILFFEHELFELHELNHSHTGADLFFEHGKPRKHGSYRFVSQGNRSRCGSPRRTPKQEYSPTDSTDDTEF